MKIHKIALVGGAALLTLAGMAVGACSSSTPPATDTGVDGGGSSSGGSSSGSSSGASSSGSSSGGSSSGSSSGASSSGSSSGGSSSGSSSGACAKPPSLHIPVADGGVYCPYSFDDATDAGIQYCSGSTPQCCVSPGTDAGSSSCTAVGACAPTTFDQWQCSAPSDCAGYDIDGGGSPVVCCLVSGAVEADTSCSGYQKTKGLDSVTCMPASQCAGAITVGTFADTHYVACEQQSDCAASGAADGGTCTAVFAIGTSIGLCL